jgi:SecD/SecF fusion protein
MKSLIYFFISIVISIILTSSRQEASLSSKNVTLQAEGNNVSSLALQKSADIISVRLKYSGIDSFEVKVSVDKKQLNIILPDKTDISDIGGLLTSKGELAFYETYTQDEISVLLKKDNQLFKFLNRDKQKSSSDPRVGCSDLANREKTDEYLHLSKPVSNCRFFWEVETKKSEYCLFALKTNEEGSPLIVGTDVESVKIATIRNSEEQKIQISLKPAAISVFADATKRNLNKSIALVIDDQVYSCPVVRNVIEGGKIEFTGNFTSKEVSYFPALFNSGQLPVSFKILK